MEEKPYPWDKAAGALIVREARGVATDLSGNKNVVHGVGVLAANPPLHAALLERLGNADKMKSAS